MIITPKVRGFICTTAHPVGCRKNVEDQIAKTLSLGVRENGPKNVLIIGASSGYGLAARIVAAFGFQANTLGIFYEKPPTSDKPASAGWYNAAAFDQSTQNQSFYSASLNADAFADETREKAIALIQNEMPGPIDLVIYSLAAPVRKLPETGELKRSALKPIGASYTATAIDTNKDTIIEATIEAANEQEISDTVAVMGGQDWELWINALEKAGVLAPTARTLAFSYIGTEITWPIYWHGTLGRAKADLEQTGKRLNKRLAAQGGGAHVAVLKSVVTQASAAIPVMPLYISIVYKIMKEKNLHETPIDQINRLMRQFMYGEEGFLVDEENRLRLDDWELRDDVQDACKTLWPKITTENVFGLTDYAAYKRDFLNLFGFARDDVDYQAEVNPEVEFDSIVV